MMAGLGGFVIPAATIGLGYVTIKPNKRGFFPVNQGAQVGPLPTIIAQAVEEELHYDRLDITSHPVEQGALITDHAFKLPAEVIIKCAWSNSANGPGNLIGAAVSAASSIFPGVGAIAAAGPTFNAAQSILSGEGANQIKSIYQHLLELQESRLPFDVYTGKRKYTNMLFEELTVQTNREKENSLWVVAHCKQIIIVTTSIIPTPINVKAQADPEATTPSVNRGVQSLSDASNFVPNEISERLGGLVNEMPFTNVPQQLKTAIDGVTYSLENKWNDLSQNWVTGISDAAGDAIVKGIPMVTGADLLEQFDYLNIGGGLIAQTDHLLDKVPTFDSLGINGRMFFVNKEA